MANYVRFADDEVLLDLDEVTLGVGLSEAQTQAMARNEGRVMRTCLTLRNGGTVYLSMSFDRVASVLEEYSRAR